jgi:hypothetical protein
MNTALLMNLSSTNVEEDSLRDWKLQLFKFFNVRCRNEVITTTRNLSFSATFIFYFEVK